MSSVYNRLCCFCLQLAGNGLQFQYVFSPGALTWKSFGEKDLDGWLYGNSQGGARMTGFNISYVYSDFQTAIIGQFRNGVLISGHEARIAKYRW